jgi:hypothetical protein
MMPRQLGFELVQGALQVQALQIRVPVTWRDRQDEKA